MNKVAKGNISWFFKITLIISFCTAFTGFIHFSNAPPFHNELARNILFLIIYVENISKSDKLF